jgi:hypothetical protein
MPQFRKKPVVIEAFRLGIDCIPDWFMNRVSDGSIILRGQWNNLESAEIGMLEGIMCASRSDWIIQGVKGEIYPCKSDIFEATYEPA